jgi:hypothetical protein
MRKSILLLAMLGLVATGTHAQRTGAIRYKWVDEKGSPHFSDSLTAEAMKAGYDLVNDRGVVMQHVPRPLTPEERTAQQQIAAQQAAAKQAEDVRRRADEQMLAAYPDEASFQRGQQDQLDTIDQRIATTRINLRNQEKTLTDLLSRAGELEHAKQPVPKFLADSIAEQRGIVQAQRDGLERAQADRAQAEQQASEQLQHYRELKAARQQP